MSNRADHLLVFSQPIPNPQPEGPQRRLCFSGDVPHALRQPLLLYLQLNDMAHPLMNHPARGALCAGITQVLMEEALATPINLYPAQASIVRDLVTDVGRAVVEDAYMEGAIQRLYDTLEDVRPGGSTALEARLRAPPRAQTHATNGASRRGPLTRLHLRLSFRADPDLEEILVGWLLRQYRPVGATDALLEVTAEQLRGETVALAARVPSPPGDPALPLATRLGAQLGADGPRVYQDPPGWDRPRGAGQREVGDLWLTDLGGSPPVLLRWRQEQGEERLHLLLDPRLLRLPQASATLRDELLLLQAIWPPTSVQASPELAPALPPDGALTVNERVRLCSVLSLAGLELAGVRLDRSVLCPSLDQRARWVIAAGASFARGLAARPEPEACVGLVPLSEGRLDAAYAVDGDESVLSPRLARILALTHAAPMPLQRAQGKLVCRGKDATRLFLDLARAAWGDPAQGSCTWQRRLDTAERAAAHAALPPEQRHQPFTLEQVPALRVAGHHLTVGPRRGQPDVRPTITLGHHTDLVTVYGQVPALLDLMRRTAPRLDITVMALALAELDAGPDAVPRDIALAIRGAAHESFLTSRLLEHGPWRTEHLSADTTLLGLVGAATDVPTAVILAKISRVYLMDAMRPPFLSLPDGLPTSYLADEQALVLSLRERPAMRDLNQIVAVAQARRDDPRMPVRRVLARFTDPAAAQKLLHNLWAREIEVWIREGRELRRIDGGYMPPQYEAPST